MRSKVTAGVLSGLVAGVFMGMGMQMMQVPTPEGGTMPMMSMVAAIARSESLAVGWVYHLFNSAVIGAIFGWLLGSRATRLGSGLTWGAAYGIAWWVIGGLILMPLLLGMPAFAPLAMAPMRPVAMGSLMGHLVFGLILGGLHAWLVRDTEPGTWTQRPAGVTR